MNENLEKTINHQIANLAALQKKQAFRIIAKNHLDITPEQWVILYYLWEKDGQILGELVSNTKKDFANVTRIVDKLISSCYVEKRKDNKDNRKSKIFLLPKGYAIKQAVIRCWKESSDISLKDISEEEQQLFQNILCRIENNVRSAMEL